jgi:hypothetical protein
MPGATEQFFAQVLDSYRAPLSRPVASDTVKTVYTELPAFLDCLARPQERLVPVAHRLGCQTDELLAASYFFVRQFLFADGEDHYRVLGLPVDADIDSIRRRYRLLIGLFHPDRINAEAQWEAQFVRRLNRAYGVLKHPEQRRAYDRQLQGMNHSKDRKITPVNHPSRNHPGKNRARGAVTSSASPTEFLYRFGFLQRHPKITVWLMIGLLLAASLIIVLSESKTTTLTLAESEPVESGIGDSVPDRLFFSGAVLHEANSGWEQQIPPVPAPASSVATAPPTTVVLEAPSMPAERRRQADIQEPRQQTSAAVVLRKKTDTPDATSPQRIDDAHPSRPLPRGFDGTLIPASIVGQQDRFPGGGDLIPAPGNDHMPQLQPEYVLMQYVRAFEAGDLDRLLNLFTLDPSSNSGPGRNLLRGDYGRLFRQTGNRKINVEQVTIRPLGSNQYQMKSRVQVTTESREGGSETRFHGEMLFSLIRKGDKLYISSLLHNVTQQPEERPEG